MHLRHASAFATTATLGLAGAARAEPPGIVWERILSDYGWLEPHDIAVDDAGDVFVLAAIPGNNYATLVFKFDPDGGILWMRIFDGSSHDIPGGMAVDGAGDVYVVGTTGSDDFALVNPWQDHRSSVQYEAFILKLDGDDGTQLYGTFFGASRSEWGNDIAVNNDGQMYIVGRTQSLDFPVVNPFQDGLAGYPYYGWDDAYLAIFSADGSELLYSTFFGGYYDDSAEGIVLDDSGRIHLVGETDSEDFYLVNPVQDTFAGGNDLFAARFSPDGAVLEYSTYLGGEGSESVRGVALGPGGRLYLDGHTRSVAFPTTTGAYQEDFVGDILGCEVPFGGRYNCDDVFIAALAPDGGSLHFSTYLGGHQIDNGYGLAVDPRGRVYATGHTRSENFPPYDSGTVYTNFVTRLDASGSDLQYTFLHETVTPSPAYLALDASGDIYLAATVETLPDLYVARLHQECAPDFNNDGTLDSLDFIAFLNAFAAGDPAADFNGDGTLDSQDFIAFLNVFVAGC